MGASQRRKGAKGEIKTRDDLRDIGIAADRSARNGKDGAADVEGWPGVNIESKWYKRFSVCRLFEKLVADTMDDEIPVMVLREDRGEGLMLLRVADFPELCKRYAKAIGKPVYPAEVK